MHSTLYNVNKSLPLEKLFYNYLPAANIPAEYRELLIPSAGIFFRQDADCEILTQHLLLGPYSVWLHDIFSKNDILIRSYTPLPIFTLQFMFEDSLAVSKVGYTLEERECSGFYFSPGELHRIPMAGDKKIFSFQINIQPTHLAALSKQHPTLSCLMTGVHPMVSTRINSRPYHVNALCDMLIRKIMTCKYQGARAQYFIQRCCTDILLNFATQHTDAQHPFIYSSMLHADVYHNIFNFLAEHPHQAHSVPELAYMYDIPVAELEHGFRQHFAISILDYMYMLNMMMIWHLVQANAIAIDDVAVVARFEDVTTMMQQVVAYYGVNPAAI
jgi:AraC-like DNA-binding protein